jgi:glucose-6-phosphate 1-epimerase
MIDSLNKTFGNESLSFSAGENNFTKATLKNTSGVTVEIYLYGAHITSWKKEPYGELLFMSSKAEFQKGKGIRGGIPVIFPQFGGGDLPAHGFARNREWKCIASENAKSPSVTFELVEDAETLAIWPSKFSLSLEIILSDKLTTILKVTNKDEKSFTFQEALHTYFKIGNISEAEVSGLKNLTYIDKVNNNTETKEHNEKLNFTTAFDRVYINSPSQIELLDKNLKQKVLIEKDNLNCSVLWNPWEGTAKMKDMHEDAYIEMICVESGNIIPKIDLSPGKSFTSTQILSVEKI